MPYGLDASEWCVLVVAALVLGLAKTLFSGLGAVAVAVFALVIPVRESTGALLPLLLVGDGVAVVAYRRHGDPRQVLKLLLGVLPGIAAGAAVLAVVGDQLLKHIIGVLLLAVGVMQFRTIPRSLDRASEASRSVFATAGVLVGFTSMTANAGGPFMNWYLLRAGLQVTQVVGTTAWGFAALNLTKVPVSFGLGLLTKDGLLVSTVLVAPLAVGCLSGALVLRSVDVRRFTRCAALIGMAAGIALLW